MTYSLFTPTAGMVPIVRNLNKNTNAVYLGVAFMCAAMLVIPFLNATAKSLRSELPVLQLVWSRYAGHFLFMLLLFMPTQGLALFKSRRPGIQLIRSMLLLTSTLCYFTALKYVSLPTAASISFTSPIIAVALAAPALGETVGAKKWFIVVFGFLGVLVVLRPGFSGTHWTGFLVLVSSACYAVYQILTRKMAGLDSAETTITYTAIVGTAILSAAMIITSDNLVVPSTSMSWTLFALIGVIAGVGHYLIVRAHEHAPVSVISPLAYIQLIGATILSVIFFGELPDVVTWVGAAMIIIASAVVVVNRH